jgi:ABC-2 type transport system permease protein
MFAEFKHTLRRMRGQMIGWGIGLALYGLMMVYFYTTIAEMENLKTFIQSYPQEMLAFFDSIMEINTPKGYMDTYYFSLMPLIIGILAVGASAGLLANDEERGILDLVLAHPVSRASLFCGRLLGLVVAMAVILIAGWLGWLVPSGSSGLELSWIELLRPFLPLLAVLLLFGTLALLFGAHCGHALRRAPGRQLFAHGAVQHKPGPQVDRQVHPSLLLPGRRCHPWAELGLAGWAAGRVPAVCLSGLGDFPATRHPRERRAELAPAEPDRSAEEKR